MRRQLRGTSYTAWDIPRLTTRTTIQQATLRTTLYRLQQRGLVMRKNDFWHATHKGKEMLRRRLESGILTLGRLNKKSPIKATNQKQKTMVIAFDIPECYRRKRTWLRNEIRMLEFRPLQKSVWIGPTPLPHDFIEAIHELNLMPYIKFFKAEKYEIV